MADYFNSPNAGQNRRAWLNGLLGSIGDSADYYLGPTGIPDRARSAGQIADMVSPVSGTLRSMDAAGRGNYGESALEGVGVLAPAAIAARFGAPAAKAVVETMTGTGNALADTGRRITDAIPSDAIYAGRSLAEGDMRGVLDAITPGRPAQGLGADAVKPVTLRGYHGTPDKNSVSAPRVDMKEPGAWFTKNVNYANDYAKGPDGRIFEADITLRNPAVVNFGYNDNGDLVAKLGDEVLDIDNNVDLVREMRRRGYDGLHTPDGNFSEADETFVAFNDDQIAVLPDVLSTKAVANDATSNASRAARNAARAAARVAPAVDTRVPYRRDGAAVASRISNIPSSKSVMGVEDLPPAGNFTKITPLQSRALPEHQSAGYLSDEIVPPRVQQSIAPLLGRDVLAIVGDQTGRHTVTSVDGKVLPNEVASKAGFQYIDVPGQGYAGASSATSSKATEAGRSLAKGTDPYYMSFMMGEQSGDFARHQGNIFGEMFKSAPIAASNVTKVDEAIRKIGVPKTVKVFDDNGNPVMNPKTGKQKTKSVKSFPFTNFGTVADPNAVSAYIDAIPTGTQRAYFLKGMDTDAFQKMGVPRVSDARLAAADPNQIGMDWGTVGYRGFTPDLERGLYPTTPAQSTTYDTGIGKVGQADTFLEGSRGIPANLLYRDLAEAQRAKGTGGGLLMNSADYKAYEMSPKRAKQTIDDLAVETVDTFLEIEKRGGRGDALRYARDILSGGKVTGAMVEAARKANAPTWVIAAMATSAGLSAANQPTQRPGLLSDI